MKKSIKKGLAVAAACLTLSLTAAGVSQAVTTADEGVCAEQTIAVAGILRQGSKGSDVKEVQRRLKQWGYYDGAVDGVFGGGTEKAVQYFQRKNGLTADGIVGAKTAAALGMTLSGTGQTAQADNSSDRSVRLLAACIYGESRGEPYKGQVAVGAVILNRVKSSKFPNSIAGVIYQ
jgi:N-acetylmuramoyl-L-alanine amidase